MKIKILIINGHLHTGGVEKSLVNLLNNIDYDKYNIDLLLLEGMGEYIEEIPQSVNVILYDLTKTYGSFFKVTFAAIKEHDWKTFFLKIVMMLRSRVSVVWIKLLKLFHITEKEYDCAIAYRVGIYNDYISYVIKANKKYMWWHHGEFDYNEIEVKRWKKSLKNIDKIICVSEASKAMIQPHFPAHKRRIEVVPNILDIDDIVNKSKEFNPYINEKKIIRIVSVGRLSPEKKMINAVYAVDSLVKQGYSRIKWYLIGDGSEREYIERTIKEKGLENFIICMGNQKNPYPYVLYADFFVHTSFVESQGISVLEAMALEKCGVVTRSRGVEEFIKDGENALLAEQKIDSLVNKIKILLDNPSVLDNMKKNQLATAKLYTADKILEKIDSLLEI